MLKSYKYAWPFIGVFLVLLATIAPILAANYVWVESNVKGVGYKNCESTCNLSEISSSNHSYAGYFSLRIITRNVSIGYNSDKWNEKEPIIWNDVPGNNSKKFLQFLSDFPLGLNWTENATIGRSPDNRTIFVSKDEHSAEFIMNESAFEAILKVNDGKTYNLTIEEEDGEKSISFSGLFDLTLDISMPFPEESESSASTIYVPENYTLIQEAVDAASPGDTILVGEGTYEENIEVYKRLTIRSEKGPDSTIVQADYPDDPVFKVTADYVNLSGFTVKGAYEDQGIYLYSANYCTISNNICYDNEKGILLIVSENNNISNNDCYLNNDSISIVLSNSNNISNNVCSDNGDDGIDLIMSNSNNISNNVCSDNEDYGIKLHMSENNNISDNNCPSNSCSIFLTYSANNSVSGNVCSYNSLYGIFIAESTNNIISNNHWTYNFVGIAPMNSSDNNSIFKNNCSDNEYGISPLNANNNDIYLNNFINNDKNAGSFESSNTWSSPSKITYTYNGKTYTNYLGNYWDDYSRSDRDKDGIGDSSYRIDGNKDRYPLMEPWEKYIS